MEFVNLTSRFFTNLYNNYMTNPKLAHLVLVFIIFYILLNSYFYSVNIKNAVEDKPAKPGEYSHSSNYSQISAMKHDMFKQITIDVLPTLLVFGIPSLIYYMIHHNDESFIPIIKLEEIITFENYRDFMNSIIGRSVLSVLGYFFFYQFIQPTVINNLPFF